MTHPNHTNNHTNSGNGRGNNDIIDLTHYQPPQGGTTPTTLIHSEKTPTQEPALPHPAATDSNSKKRWVAAGTGIVVTALIGAGGTYSLWSDAAKLGGVPGRFAYGIMSAGFQPGNMITPTTTGEQIILNVPNNVANTAEAGTNIHFPLYVNARGQGNVDLNWSISNGGGNGTGVFENAVVSVSANITPQTCATGAFDTPEPPIAAGPLNNLSSTLQTLLTAPKGEEAHTGPTSTVTNNETLCVSINIPETPPQVEKVTVEAKTDIGAVKDSETVVTERDAATGGTASLVLNWNTSVVPYRVTPTETSTEAPTETAAETATETATEPAAETSTETPTGNATEAVSGDAPTPLDTSAPTSTETATEPLPGTPEPTSTSGN